MGVSYSASCPCGFWQGMLESGSGWSGIEFQLLQCTQCHHLQVSKSITKRKRCSRCRSSKLSLFNAELQNLVFCPECGEMSLKLEIDGLWD